MDPQKALHRRTYNSISHRRRHQPRTPIQTFPRAHHHSLAGSTLGTQLSHLHHLHLRIIKANGLLRHLPRHRTLLPRQATTARNNHLRVGFHRITPQAGLPPRALLRPRGAAVGRLRLHLIPLKDIRSSSSSQGVSSMAGAEMAAVGTGVEAVAAVTAGEEDGDRF